MNADARAPAATPDCSAPDCELGAPALEAILAIVRERTGVDFANYRPAAVGRRTRNRMLTLGIEQPLDYLEFLRRTESEAQRLLERLTIKVSRFYRHAPAFDCLRQVVLPELARAHPTRALRIRSVGCGAGEEAWTLAMLLDEAGVAGVIDATDVDSSALAAAREAVYRAAALAELPAALAGRYLEPVSVADEQRYRVREELRGRVSFWRHDITAAAGEAAESYDLVCCRNILIYLEPATKERTLRALLQMMGAGAYLCLGEVEWPTASLASSLRALARDARVFRFPGPALSGDGCR